MFKIFDEKLNGLLFVVIFPFLLFFISYYGFESSYVRLKSMERVPDFMFSSVYAYRVIPNYLSIYVTSGLTYIVDHHLYSLKGILVKNGTLFYHSIFLINSFFFILSSILLEVILKYKPTEFLLNNNVRRLVHLIAVFFIVIIQYVPTNCDSIALFFYLLGVLFTLRYFQNRKVKYLLGICVVIFISTFVRETACLNIAFFAALFINVKELRKGNLVFVKDVVLLVIAFVLPYIALRLMIHQKTSFFEGVYIIKNFTSPFNLAGLLFGVIGIYFTFIFCDSNSKTILKKYLFFSLPYLVMITLVGLFWETRLFLPLVLTGIVLASYQFKNIHITQ